MNSQTEILYLFSSNMRPLYVQDILDLLALPAGGLHQFRYEARWVDQKTQQRWSGLKGLDVLVHFSMQQAAEYHPPAFIPVRLGTVTRAEVVGSIYLVDFEVRGYVSLRKAVESGKSKDVYGRSVRGYIEVLDGKQIGRPYDCWASVGASVLSSLDVTSDQVILFQRTTEFLSKTEWFRRARYLLILSLRESGRAEGYAADPEIDIRPTEGKFRLKGGTSYELTLAHTQPNDIQAQEGFTVSTDESVLRVIGEQKSFEASSEYDIVRIILHAVQPPTSEPRETVLAIDPSPGVQGPRLRMRTEVGVDPAKTAVSVLGTAAGAALLGLPSLINLPGPWSVLCVALGALWVAWLTQAGFKSG